MGDLSESFKPGDIATASDAASDAVSKVATISDAASDALSKAYSRCATISDAASKAMSRANTQSDASSKALSKANVALSNASDAQSAAASKLPLSAFSGLSQITVGSSAPSSPDTGDLWVDTAAPTSDFLQFTDNFADASRWWGWYDHNTDANRTIVESGGVLTIAIAGGTTTDWWSAVNSCPKAIMGITAYPCTIICKLNTLTINNKTIAGMFVASDALGSGADFAVYYGPGRDDGAAVNGLMIESLGTRQYTNAVTTRPIWLKMLVTADSGGCKMTFFYSTDGTSYTDTGTTYVALARAAGLVTGLFAKNWDGAALSAPFEFITITNDLQGPG